MTSILRADIIAMPSVDAAHMSPNYLESGLPECELPGDKPPTILSL